MRNLETKKRSLLKSVSWRITATSATIVLVLALTGEPRIALSAGVLEVLIKLALFYVHERAWVRIPFAMKKDVSVVIWLTGLSGAGKSTVAKRIVEVLRNQGKPVEWLDGDVTREFVPSTGFSKEERDRHVLSTGFMARTLESHGVWVVASYISPFKETRRKVRKMCKCFMEVYLETPLSVCEQRDVKGLYAKARAGEIKEFTGIDSPYEPPDDPEIRVSTTGTTPEDLAKDILDQVDQKLRQICDQ